MQPIIGRSRKSNHLAIATLILIPLKMNDRGKTLR